MSRVVLLAGGVGGARLSLPVMEALSPEDQLTVVVNVGDDFAHLGLPISPDLDTVLYHLSGLADVGRGWGQRDETFHCMEALAGLGGPGWFWLGDRDLATHLWRAELLRQGFSLSAVTRQLARRWGIPAQVVVTPVTDDPVATWVDTDAGWLPFQTYLVKRQARDPVKGFEYRGADTARPAPGVLEAIRDAERIIVAPSNPFVSLLPMLAVPGVHDAIRQSSAKRLGVSPLIGGRAVKGPLAEMLQDLGRPVTVASALEAARIPLDAVWMDPTDSGEADAVRALGAEVILASVWLLDPEQRQALAQALLYFGEGS